MAECPTDISFALIVPEFSITEPEECVRAEEMLMYNGFAVFDGVYFFGDEN